jgi:NAD(P)H-hydrate repair Nnr-like enzyme with NAD(P)H-hydrate epimerase domain
MAGMTDEVLTPAEMSRADQLAGVSFKQLMENAGRAVADEIVRRYSKRNVTVLCGPGNNGGDGQVVARLLKKRGWKINVYTAFESFKPGKLIVDAIFGAGLSRDFPADLAERINGAGVPIVAIDVPSGLDGLTGSPRGASVKADLTVTFFRKKPGHLLLPGRTLCGEVVVADIGIPCSVLGTIGPTLFENAKPELAALDHSTHKYKRGHAAIWSGGPLNSGASRLAALAAQRAGVGLVTIRGHREALLVHAAHVGAVHRPGRRSLVRHQVAGAGVARNRTSHRSRCRCAHGLRRRIAGPVRRHQGRLRADAA